jgi:hypothetical protein
MRLLTTTFALLLLLPAVAHAAAPANDARTAALAVTLPASESGTTVDSTLDADEPSGCQPLKGSVWYSLSAADTTRIVVRLQAAGDLDATVDVYRRSRSQITSVTCDTGDDDGQAEVTFKPEKGASYLIRVGQRANSVAGTFKLDVFAPQPAPSAPGPALPSRGASNSLDRVQDTADAWSTVMRAGTSYRINLSQPEDGCVSVGIYPPGTHGDFDDADPVKTLHCGGYTLFTPAAGKGGRYAFEVNAQSSARGAQAYHLQVARAAADDTAPGLPLANYQKARGSLRGGGIDVVDLYRFSLAKRSDLKVTVGGTEFGLELLNDAGHRLASDDGELERRLSPGRYFVAVRAEGRDSGSYTLTRAARTITRTSVSLQPSKASPGQSVRVAVKISPGGAGPVRITLQRFDPLAGWQFFRQVTVQASGGSAGYSFTPPAVGRWRATAAFLGTRADAPSSAGYSGVIVAGPLGGT